MHNELIGLQELEGRGERQMVDICRCGAAPSSTMFLPDSAAHVLRTYRLCG